MLTFTSRYMNPKANADLKVGARVTIGSAGVVYEVIHLFDNRAWVRNERDRWDAVVDQDQLSLA